jgi:hypothetical protein
MKKLLLAGAVLAMVATPALAQSLAPNLGIGTNDFPTAYSRVPAQGPVYAPRYGYRDASPGYGTADAGVGYGSYAMSGPGDAAYAEPDTSILPPR